MRSYGLSCFSCVRFFVALWTAARQAPLSMGILPARILEWVPMPSCRESSPPRDQTHGFCIAGGFFAAEPRGKPIVCECSLVTVSGRDLSLEACSVPCLFGLCSAHGHRCFSSVRPSYDLFPLLLEPYSFLLAGNGPG